MGLDSVPQSRIESVKQSFENADEDIRNVIEKISHKLNVSRCRKHLDDTGAFVTEISHYSEKDNVIRMDEAKDNEEYAITFRHEYGHFADAQLGRPSLSDNFGYAIQADIDRYVFDNENTSENFDYMLTELQTSDAFDSRYISDILSGMFLNHNKIREVYLRNGVPFYQHSDAYWKGEAGVYNAAEREIFANLFAIYAENDATVVDFVEKFFPNVSIRFKKMLRGN